MEIALVLAFVISNLFWIAFTYFTNVEHMKERASLLVRIQRPEIIYPQDKKMTDEELMKMVEEEEDEIDLVGKVDPELPLRGEE
jgi:hypothetical protein